LAVCLEELRSKVPWPARLEIDTARLLGQVL
jgi:hypothetical protein